MPTVSPFSLPTRFSLFVAALLLLWVAPAVPADPDLSEHGSVAVSSAVVVSSVGASVEALATVPELSIVGVEASADGAVWILRGVAEGSGEAVELSVRVAGGASMAVGTALGVVTTAAGSLLIASGQALAFVPNELGASLYYSTTWEDREEDREHRP